jgi:hypothetical protein
MPSLNRTVPLALRPKFSSPTPSAVILNASVADAAGLTVTTEVPRRRTFGWFIVTTVIVQLPPLTQTVSSALKVMLFKAPQLIVREQVVVRVGHAGTVAQLCASARRANVKAMPVMMAAETMLAAARLMSIPAARG